MGEGGKPKRSKASDLTVEVTNFSVPTWQSVVMHEEETRFYKGHPPPDMGAEAIQAGKVGRFLVGTHHSKATGMTHPYVFSSTVGTEYLYPCHPSDGLIFPPELGTPSVEYSFHSQLPSDLSILYTRPEEKDLRYPCIARTEGGRLFFVAPVRGDGSQVVELMSEEESMMTATVRAAVLYYVYGFLEQPKWAEALSEVLPYLNDTIALAQVRMQHVTRWQFKSSRTRPLYA
jgi:hypothetical protein